MPSKHKTFAWHLHNVVPASSTAGPKLYKCYTNVLCLLGQIWTTISALYQYHSKLARYCQGYIVASELKDPIWHSSEWQIGSFSSEATIWCCRCHGDLYGQTLDGEAKVLLLPHTMGEWAIIGDNEPLLFWYGVGLSPLFKSPQWRRKLWMQLLRALLIIALLTVIMGNELLTLAHGRGP